MNDRRQHHRQPSAGAWCLAWLAASLLLAGQVIRAEDDIAVDEIDLVEQQRQQQRQANRYDLGGNFDANLFEQVAGFSLNSGRRRGSVTGGDGEQAPESATLAFLRRLGDARLARIDSICGLTDAQRRKVRLAMESDIRRLAEEVDAVRTKYTGVEANLGDQEGQRKWQQFQQDVQRCRQLFQGQFDAESLFAKVLPSTLDAEQQARLTAESAARRSYRWRALVVAALRKYDDMLGLDQRQYDELEKLLLEREPPLWVDRPFNAAHMHAEQMLVPMVLADIGAKRLQAAVSDRQWKTLAQLASQGKAMRSYIEAQGLLEKVAK